MRGTSLRSQLVLNGEVKILRTAGVPEHIHCECRQSDGAVEYSCGRPHRRPGLSRYSGLAFTGSS